MMKATVAIFFLTFVHVITLAAKWQEINVDDVFVSSDGKFQVKFLGGSLDFVERETKRHFPLVPIDAGISALYWTKDSKTVVVQEHLAGGSEAVLVHFNGNEWRRQSVEPETRSFYRLAVIGLVTEEHDVLITYSAIAVKEGAKFEYFICSFRINPSNGHRSEELCRRVTGSEHTEIINRIKKNGLRSD